MFVRFWLVLSFSMFQPTHLDTSQSLISLGLRLIGIHVALEPSPLSSTSNKKLTSSGPSKRKFLNAGERATVSLPKATLFVRAHPVVSRTTLCSRNRTNADARLACDMDGGVIDILWEYSSPRDDGQFDMPNICLSMCPPLAEMVYLKTLGEWTSA
jgi:hypothetical protein